MRQQHRNKHEDSCEIKLAPFNGSIYPSQIAMNSSKIELNQQNQSGTSSSTTLTYTLTNTIISLETIKKIDKRSQMVNQALQSKKITKSRSFGKILDKYVFLPKISNDCQGFTDQIDAGNEAENSSDLNIQDLIEQATPQFRNQLQSVQNMQRKSSNQKVFNPSKCLFNVMTKAQIPEEAGQHEGQNYTIKISGPDEDISQYSMTPLEIDDVRSFYYNKQDRNYDKIITSKHSSFESSSSTNCSSQENSPNIVIQQPAAIQIQEQKFCRICKLDQQSSLIRPCECDEPALQHVHKNCMVAQIYNDMFYTENITNIDKNGGPISPNCEICKTQFMYNYDDDDDDENRNGYDNDFDSQCKCCCKTKIYRSIFVIILSLFFSTSLLAFGIAILKGWIMINDNVAKELANEVFYISGGIFLLFLLSLFLFCKNLMKRVARRKRLRKRARVFDQNQEEEMKYQEECKIDNSSFKDNGNTSIIPIDDIEEIKAEQEGDDFNSKNNPQLNVLRDIWADNSVLKQGALARRQAWNRSIKINFCKSSRDGKLPEFF